MELLDSEVRNVVVTATEKAFSEDGSEAVYIGVDRRGVTESVAVRHTDNPDVDVFVALAAWAPGDGSGSLMIQSAVAVKNLASTLRREVDTLTLTPSEQYRDLHGVVMRAVESAFRLSDRVVSNPPVADRILPDSILSSTSYEALARRSAQ